MGGGLWFVVQPRGWIGQRVVAYICRSLKSYDVILCFFLILSVKTYLNRSSRSSLCLYYIIVPFSLVEDLNKYLLNVSFEVFGIANLCFKLKPYIGLLYDACLSKFYIQFLFVLFIYLLLPINWWIKYLKNKYIFETIAGDADLSVV